MSAEYKQSITNYLASVRNRTLGIPITEFTQERRQEEITKANLQCPPSPCWGTSAACHAIAPAHSLFLAFVAASALHVLRSR